MFQNTFDDGHRVRYVFTVKVNGGVNDEESTEFDDKEFRAGCPRDVDTVVRSIRRFGLADKRKHVGRPRFITRKRWRGDDRVERHQSVQKSSITTPPTWRLPAYCRFFFNERYSELRTLLSIDVSLRNVVGRTVIRLSSSHPSALHVGSSACFRSNRSRTTPIRDSVESCFEAVANRSR